MPYTYEESEETQVAMGTIYSKDSIEIDPHSEWLTNVDWFFFCLFCDDSEAVEQTYRDAFDDGQYTTGVMPMYVQVEDAIDGQSYSLYYAVNLGIDEDPSVDISTSLIGASSAFYDVEYTTAEKNELLSQYKRYSQFGSDEGSEISEAIQNTVSNLINNTLNTLVSTQGLMNFKKTPQKSSLSNNLYSLNNVTRVTLTEFTGSADSASTTTSNVATTSITTMGGY